MSPGLLDTLRVLRDHDVGVEWCHTSCNPVLTVARAQLVRFFMNSPATHLLMVDDDHGWTGADVLRLLGHGVPFACAAYARKSGGAFDLAGDLRVDKSRGLASAGAAGLGFALLRRDLFTQMIEAYPERRMQTEGMWNFFPVEAVDGVFIDEDYSFCKLWRDTGGEIWVDLNVHLSHLKMADVAGPKPIDALSATLSRRAAAA